MTRQKVSWNLYWIGTVLIIMSWTDTVSHQVGWIGFAIALTGSAISWQGAASASIAREPPTPRSALFEKARQLAERRRYPEAEAIYHEALLENPKDSDAFVGLAACRLSQRDPDDAKSYFRRAIEVDPFSMEARVGLAQLAIDRADYRGAEREYRQALAVTPNAVEALWGLAVVRDKLGDHAEAIAQMERIMTLVPGSDFARRAQARIAEIRSRS